MYCPQQDTLWLPFPLFLLVLLGFSPGDSRVFSQSWTFRVFHRMLSLFWQTKLVVITKAIVGIVRYSTLRLRSPIPPSPTISLLLTPTWQKRKSLSPLPNLIVVHFSYEGPNLSSRDLRRHPSHPLRESSLTGLSYRKEEGRDHLSDESWGKQVPPWTEVLRRMTKRRARRECQIDRNPLHGFYMGKSSPGPITCIEQSRRQRSRHFTPLITHGVSL